MKREAGAVRKNPSRHCPAAVGGNEVAIRTGALAPGSSGLGGSVASASMSPKTCRQPREAHRAVPAAESPGGEGWWSNADRGLAVESRPLRRRLTILLTTGPAQPPREGPPRASRMEEHP